MPKTEPRIPPELGRLIDIQQGVVTRRQALSSGMSRSAWKHRTSCGGRWQRLLPGVCATHNGPPTLIQRIIAALLYAGPGAVLTGNAALWHHRLPGRYGLEQIDVLVPHQRHQSIIEYVRIQRTRRMPPHVGEMLPFAPVERAVGDACRRLDEIDDGRAIVAAAAQQRKCTVEALTREAADGPIRGSALLREAVGEALAGIRSAAEGRGRHVLRRAGLPEAQWNVDLYDQTGEWLCRPDAWWGDAGVALEIDSREWHLDPAAWERTMERHARMTGQGILVVHVSPKLIWRRPDEFVARVRDALKAGGCRPHLLIREREDPPGEGAPHLAMPG